MSKNNKGQSNNIKNKELEEKKAFRVAFAYALVFALVLIVFGVTGTYAYYNVTISGTSGTTSISANTPCFNVTLSDTGAYNLKYNYPITDTFATSGSNITPLTVTVKNSCSSGNAIPYKLYLTTLPVANTNIPNSAMKINVKKGTTQVIPTKKISELTTETANVDTIKKAIQAKGTSAAGLVNGLYYSITSGSVSPSGTDTYSFIMWIDYNEGGTGTTNNNSTAGKKFSAIVSAIIN